MKTLSFSNDILNAYELLLIKGGNTGPGDGPVDLNDEDIDIPDL